MLDNIIRINVNANGLQTGILMEIARFVFAVLSSMYMYYKVIFHHGLYQSFD